jgi:hypothetical protein
MEGEDNINNNEDHNQGEEDQIGYQYKPAL